jgi:hypothetical protein
VLVTVATRTTTVDHKKLSLSLKYRLNSVPGACAIVHALATIGNKGPYRSRVNSLCRWRHHNQEALAMQRHEGLAALGMALKTVEFQR